MVLAVGGLALCTACRDGTAPGTGGQVGVGFQLATTSSAASVAGGGAGSTGGVTVIATEAGLTIDRGADTIVITRAHYDAA